MTEPSALMKLVVLLVACVAGYAVVSFVVRKLKEGPFYKEPKNDEEAGPSGNAVNPAADEGPQQRALENQREPDQSRDMNLK
jgi:hypothetical protein